jgi:hypothetical protein
MVGELHNLVKRIPGRHRVCLGLLLVGFAIWTGFNVNTPIFEAPDEQHHFHTSKYIADTGTLPFADINTLPRQAAAQSPLYYVVAAVVLKLSDLDTKPTTLIDNPFVEIPSMNATANVNAFVHSHGERWPWRDLSLAVHLVRFLSAAAGLVTLLSIYGTAILLWPAIPLIAICATGLVAFLPQFGFLHGAITNDTFLIASCSFALYLFVKAALLRFPLPYSVAIGGVVGLGVLSKMSGAVLALYLGVLIVVFTWNLNGWRYAIRFAAPYAAAVIVVCGWLFWRNQALYGDPTAMSVFVDFGGGERAYSIGLLRAEADRIWKSAIGVFGWLNVPAPDWVMVVWLSIVVVSFFGAAIAFMRYVRHTKPEPATLPYDIPAVTARVMPPRASETQHNDLFAALLVWPIVVTTFWLQFLWRTPADQGRLLFPALLPVALLLAYGLVGFGRPLIPVMALVAAFSTAFYASFILIPQTYRLPELITGAEIPASALRLDQDMGQGVRLLASETDATPVHPGERVTIDLYWTIDEPIAESVLVAPEIVGRDFRRIAGLPLSYHGNGMFPTVLWEPGQVVHQRIHLPVEEGAVVPTEGKVLVRIEGESPLVQVGTIKVISETWPTLAQSSLAEFDHGIVLSSATIAEQTVSPGENLMVNLVWLASQHQEKNLTRFVHIGDPNRPPLGQADGIPAQSAYPTSWWDEGEVIDDTVTLTLPVDLPPGTYPVNVGFYDPQDGLRLAATVNGSPAPNGAVTVGEITVNE